VSPFVAEEVRKETVKDEIRRLIKEKGFLRDSGLAERVA